MRRASGLSMQGGRENDERMLCCDIFDIGNWLGIWKIIL